MTDDDTKRTKQTQHIASVIPFEKFTAPEPPDGWDAHDRRVAEARERDARADADLARRQRAQAMVDDAHFPKKAVRHVLDGMRRTRATDYVASFLDGDRTTLFLCGGTGAGKTTGATLFAIDHGGPSPGFVRAGELESRGRYDKGLRDWMRERSSLVIDDLGVEVNDSAGVFRSLLDETLDLFHGDEKRVVITTNIGRDTAHLRYGERMVSRLYESGLWCDCGDVDLRKSLPSGDGR